MGRINVKTTVTAPDSITIPLVRADMHGTGQVFRIFFEIFLTISAIICGHIIGKQNIELIYYIILAISGLFCLLFLGTSIYYSYQSKKSVNDE